MPHFQTAWLFILQFVQTVCTNKLEGDEVTAYFLNSFGNFPVNFKNILRKYAVEETPSCFAVSSTDIP